MSYETTRLAKLKLTPSGLLDTAQQTSNHHLPKPGFQNVAPKQPNYYFQPSKAAPTKFRFSIDIAT
jgi:hypothetical protein